jgi:hypothetical protein
MFSLTIRPLHRNVVLVAGALLVLFAFLGSGTFAQAAFGVCNDGSAAGTQFCQEATQGDGTPGAGIFGPDSVVTRVTEAIIFVSGAIAVLMIVTGGLRYVLSQGDPGATQNAKNTILYAVVGLVIAIAAELILRLVLTRL